MILWNLKFQFKLCKVWFGMNGKLLVFEIHKHCSWLTETYNVERTSNYLSFANL